MEAKLWDDIPIIRGVVQASGWRNRETCHHVFPSRLRRAQRMLPEGNQFYHIHSPSSGLHWEFSFYLGFLTDHNQHIRFHVSPPTMSRCTDKHYSTLLKQWSKKILTVVKLLHINLQAHLTSFSVCWLGVRLYTHTHTHTHTDTHTHILWEQTVSHSMLQLKLQFEVETGAIQTATDNSCVVFH